MLLALWGMVASLGVPIVKGISALITGPQYAAHTSRVRTVLVSLVLLILAALFVVPAPRHTLAQGVLWLPEQAILRAGVNGFIAKVSASAHTQVVPGHYIGERPAGDKAIRFTQDYLQSFEQAVGAKKGSDYVIKTITAAWPGLADASSLELSAKVNTGEMKW